MKTRSIFVDPDWPRSFLRDHWQRQPCLFEDLVIDSLPPITRDELIALASGPDSNARWIDCTGTPQQWSLKAEPLDRSAGPWTLLVQEIDRQLPAFAELLEQFRFVPNWRIDDVMVSLATDGAGVGPHIDRYDVFLIQLCGRRRWRINTTPVAEQRLAPDASLPVLESFDHDQEWTLEPGSMLYLPPRIPHEGVAVGECITCSIGFRTPDPRELAAGFLRQLGPAVFDGIRHTDPGRQPIASAGELTADARQALRHSVRQLFDDRQAFDLWVGCLVTRPLRDEPLIGQPVALATVSTLQRSAPAHFAWFADDTGDVHLFVGGEHYPLGPGRESQAELLCGRQELTGKTLGPWIGDSRLAPILTDLMLRGYLRS